MLWLHARCNGMAKFWSAPNTSVSPAPAYPPPSWVTYCVLVIESIRVRLREDFHRVDVGVCRVTRVVHRQAQELVGCARAVSVGVNQRLDDLLGDVGAAHSTVQRQHAVLHTQPPDASRQASSSSASRHHSSDTHVVSTRCSRRVHVQNELHGLQARPGTPHRVVQGNSPALCVGQGATRHSEGSPREATRSVESNVPYLVASQHRGTPL